MAELLKGAPVAKAITERNKQAVSELQSKGITPVLAIVRLGEKAGDLAYERGACKRCDTVGIAVRQFVLPADCSQEDLLATIAQVNEDTSIHGCLLFRPLPEGLDEVAACNAIDPAKDVDCATDGSLLGVFTCQLMDFRTEDLNRFFIRVDGLEKGRHAFDAAFGITVGFAAIDCAAFGKCAVEFTDGVFKYCFHRYILCFCYTCVSAITY